jgi:hypothetical protein
MENVSMTHSQYIHRSELHQTLEEPASTNKSQAAKI